MQQYDVFKSQGGYAVALGIYLECPVVGAMEWFETKKAAESFSQAYPAYQKALQTWEDKCIDLMPCEESKLPPMPQEQDFGLIYGIRI